MSLSSSVMSAHRECGDAATAESWHNGRTGQPAYAGTPIFLCSAARASSGEKLQEISRKPRHAPIRAPSHLCRPPAGTADPTWDGGADAALHGVCTSKARVDRSGSGEGDPRGGAAVAAATLRGGR